MLTKLNPGWTDLIPVSIAPPSDIILDVAQAADPLKLQAATSKLAKAAAGADPAASFSAALDSTVRAAAPQAAAVRTSALPAPARFETKQATANQKFEAMVLQSFIENILPKNAELFGDAASADMGRTLLAEQIAKQIAKSGQVGIARSLERGAAGAAGAHVLPSATPTLPRA